MPQRKPPLATRAALHLFRRYRRVQAKLHELNYLFWECTLRCNLACRHCGSDCHRDAATADMPLGDFLGVLDEVATACDPHTITLAVTGGEPLMRGDLEECGKEFRKRGYPWGMVSNGYTLTDARLEALLGAGLGSLTISLDGLEDSHNWLRGLPDSFAKALAAAEAAAHSDALVFDVVTCVNGRNFGELEALRDLLISKGVRRWRLFTIFPKGRAQDDPELDVSNEQFEALLQFIRATRNESGLQADYGCEGYLGPYEGNVRDGFFFCHAGVHVGSVLADGSISACPSLRGDYIQGNIYQDSFLDCWENRFQIMRDRGWTKTGECAACPAYCWCEGNGLHLRDEKTGDVLRCHLHMLEQAGQPPA